MENSVLNEIVVLLNQQTLNGKDAPIAQTSPYDIYNIVDGWFFDNTINDSYINSINRYINWTIFPKNQNGGLIQINPYVNRIYMICYIYKIGTPLSAIPKIVITLNGTFSGTITFAYTGIAITNAGHYCFVADIGSNTSTFGQIYNENADIYTLSFESSSPTGQTLSTTNISGNSITSISIVTTTTSNYRIIISSISLELNNSTNTFGGSTDTSTSYKNSGVNQYLFNSNSVSRVYCENTVSYMYNAFYAKKPSKLVSPLDYTIPTAST